MTYFIELLFCYCFDKFNTEARDSESRFQIISRVLAKLEMKYFSKQSLFHFVDRFGSRTIPSCKEF
jgi:hypothetical protein